MTTRISQLYDETINGALIGAFVGFMSALFVAFDSSTLPQFDFFLGAFWQAFLQIAVGCAFGFFLGGITVFIALIRWKSELASVLQTFMAPAVFTMSLAVCVYCFNGTLPPAANQIFFLPLLTFVSTWVVLWLLFSCIAFVTSMGGLSD